MAGTQVAVEFEAQATRVVDGVIGADGARSLVRAHVTGSMREPAYRGYTIWRGIVELDLGGDASNKMQETWGRGRRFGILPMGQKALCWYATDTRAKTQDDSVENRKLEISRLFSGWPSPIPEIIRATSPDDILASAAADLGLRRPWFDHNVVIIGDAAHPLTPNVGQGCCLALEDAFGLSRALQKTGEVERAFELFGQTRRKRVAAIVRTTRWMAPLDRAGARLPSSFEIGCFHRCFRWCSN